MSYLSAANSADSAAFHARNIQAAGDNNAAFANMELGAALVDLAEAVAELARSQHRAQ